MRPADEDTWEVEYWDELLHEFGVSAYIEARLEALGHGAPNAREEHDMEFNVSIIGTKEVNIALENLDEEVANALDNELSGSDLEDVSIEEFDPPEDVDIEVKFTASVTVELDQADLEQLVRDQVESTLGNAGVTDFDIDTIDEV